MGDRHVGAYLGTMCKYAELKLYTAVFNVLQSQKGVRLVSTCIYTLSKTSGMFVFV